MAERICVVGAGLAGLMAASRLQAAGRNVTLFDKGRRPGGRANTREHGAHRFDHGAQFFTLRDERITPLLAEWLDRGLVAEWRGRLVRIEGSTTQPATPGPRFVGVPGMIEVALALASDLDVRPGVRIAALDRTTGGWEVVDDRETRYGPFDRVVVAVPAPQAVPLLEVSPTLQGVAARAEMAPCWAAMVVFERPAPLDFDGAFVSDGPISWMARDGSKPDRPHADAWVLHAGPDWTRAHWEADREDVPGLLVGHLEKRWGVTLPTVFERAHRWGYALAGPPPGDGAAYDATSGVGVCGDWCVGGRVEGALVSGIEIADRLLQLDGA